MSANTLVHALVVVPVLLCAPAVLAGGPTPEDTMRAFYSWVLAHPSRSLPSAKERAVLGNLLAPELVELLKSASETEARCVKTARRGDKPDILEGNLFVGNYEGATEVAYAKRQRNGDKVSIAANLVYIDSRFPKAHVQRAVAWQDHVDLRQLRTGWAVADVRFAEGRSLSAALTAYIEAGAGTCTTRP
jgi:hypothetical protein